MLLEEGFVGWKGAHEVVRVWLIGVKGLGFLLAFLVRPMIEVNFFIWH